MESENIKRKIVIQRDSSCRLQNDQQKIIKIYM